MVSGKTGFASGVVVTANGLCGFFMAPISRKILDAEGPQRAFLVIGVVIAVSWILCGIFFHVPDRAWQLKAESDLQNNISKNETWEKKQKQYTSSEMMHTKNFYSAACNDVIWVDFIFSDFSSITNLSD